jgi:hypothetical protein
MTVPDFSPYLNAMMEYWGPMMDVGLERARAMPEREAIAFDQYLRRMRKEDQLSEEQIKKSQLERKFARREYGKNTLSAAPRRGPTPSQARSSATRGATRDMLTTKTDLDSLLGPWGRGYNYGINPAFKNMPAASAMTGLSLPPSGFETYANLAGAGSRQSATAEQAASDWRLWNPEYRADRRVTAGQGAGSLGR